MSRFRLLYGFLIAVLLLALLSAFALRGPLSWSTGLLYVAYDSFILYFVVSVSARGLKTAAPPAGAGAAEPTVSAVIPARNERAVLNDCLEALLLRQTRSPDEIIIVDDGSSDGTVDWLARRFQVVFSGDMGRSAVHSALRVIRKAHTGKAESLNAGWRAAGSEVVVTVDADTVLEPEAIAEIRRSFARDPDLAAAGGVLSPRCVGSRAASFFEFYQRFEYVRSFLERYAWMSLGTLVLASGAFAAFRRDVLERLGGFNKDSRVEDYELIYRLYRDFCDRGLVPRVAVIAGARAATEAPSTLKSFLLQRSRWFAGFLETLFSNKDMVANPKYGRMGRFLLPLKLLDTLKPVYGLAALLVFLVYFILGFRPYLFIVYILAAKLLFDVVFHCRAFVLYHQWQKTPISPGLWARSLLAIITEPFAFQILRHVAAVMGILAYFHGRIGWAPQRRDGEAA